MKIKLGIVIVLALISPLLWGQYDAWNDQGILIKDTTLVHFNPFDYAYREMWLNPSEWEKKLFKSGPTPYVINGYLSVSPDFKNIIVVHDASYFYGKMWGGEVKPYEKHQFTLYFRVITPTLTEVSKDNTTWEPLQVEFRSYDNLWPTGSDFLPYLHTDYKCTLYIKCSFFEGLYDAFTYPEEPG